MKRKSIYLISVIILAIVCALMLGHTYKSEAASSMPPPGKPEVSPAPQSAPPTSGGDTETAVLTGTSADIKGKFKVGLRVPGGTKDSIFTLACDGPSVTGDITNPYKPDEHCAIYNGKAEGNKFHFSAMIDKAEYNFEGTAGKGSLSMTVTTLETISLGDGSKIRTSKETAIDGAYLVPVYSPGGVMENIFFLKTEGNALTGQMVMISNPMKDKSDFFDGSVKGNEVSFYTRTPQSLFHFVGTIDGDKIKLKLIVTDIVKGIKGSSM